MPFSPKFPILNILAYFEAFQRQGKASGHLESKNEISYGNLLLRPNLAYFEQRDFPRFTRPRGDTPTFVVEKTTHQCKVVEVLERLRAYRNAGVEVVWQIYPEIEEIYVYRGVQMTICRGDDRCSAAPALPDFELSASEVFKKPPLPETT